MDKNIDNIIDSTSFFFHFYPAIVVVFDLHNGSFRLLCLAPPGSSFARFSATTSHHFPAFCLI